MRTPAGKECRFFYGDYYRGRSNEECNLLEPAGLSWNPGLCTKCPMPAILAANACEHMRYKPRIERGLLRKPQVKLEIYCIKSESDVNEPRVGCGQCHPLPSVFVVSPDDPQSP
jgi:hypothetical protein